MADRGTAEGHQESHSTGSRYAREATSRRGKRVSRETASERGKRYAEGESQRPTGGSRYADKNKSVENTAAAQNRLSRRALKRVKPNTGNESAIEAAAEKKAEQVAPSSGSRYADKQPAAAKVSRLSKVASAVKVPQLGKTPEQPAEEAKPEVQQAEVQQSAPAAGSRYTDKQSETLKPVRGKKLKFSMPKIHKKTEGSEVESLPSGQNEVPASAAAQPTEETKAPRKGFFREENFLLSLRHGDPLAIAICLLAVVLLSGYTYFAVYFNMHFFPGTKIYDIDSSRMTAEEVKELVKKKVATYELEIDGRDDAKVVFDADQIGLEYEDDGGIDKALKEQAGIFWPITLLTHNTNSAKIGTTYDMKKVREAVSNMDLLKKENQVAPEDAKLVIGEDYLYEIQPEVNGTTLDPDSTREAIIGALDTGKTSVSLNAADCYVKPKVTQDDPELHEEMEKYNPILGANITLNFGDRTEVVDADVIKTFLGTDENGNLYVEDAPVWDYVSELAKKYDTYNTERDFVTSYGETVHLYYGDYGWEIEQNETAQTILDMVRNKEVATIDPIYTQTAASRDENDIGDTYVEVSIGRQEMWVYQNGELVVDTAVVTGNEGAGNGTPSNGIWYIYSKDRNATLVGEGYSQPVDYWMPFNGGVGIHDAQWRYDFGGDIYLYAGSHGCVNTPLDQVAIIWDVVSYGTPVIVYD